MGSSWRRTSLLLAVLCALHCRLGESQHFFLGNISVGQGALQLFEEKFSENCPGADPGGGGGGAWGAHALPFGTEQALNAEVYRM